MKPVRATAMFVLMAATLLDGAEIAHVTGRSVDLISCDGVVNARQLCAGAGCKTVTIPFATVAQSRGSLDLPSGAWELTVTSLRCWAPAIVTAGGVSSTLPVWRSARVHGTIDPETNNVAGPLRAELRLIGEGDAHDESRLSEECSIGGGQWSCGVPATGFHLRLSLDHDAPWYARNVIMTPREERDFGAIRFERGASIAGTIAMDRARQVTVVELTPIAAPGSPPQKKKDVRRVLAKDSNGGLFQFTGVPHGTYRITASRPGWLPVEVKSIQVGEGRESFLSKALQLQRAAVVDVFITPPLATEEESWVVRLESTADAALNKPVVESAAAFTGEWRDDALHAGRYVLSVLDRHGNVFRRETVEAGIDAAPQALKIIKVRVRGVVTAGTVPLESQLVFSDDESSATFTFQADTDGKFEGILSHEGKWFVQVLNPARTFYVKDVPLDVKHSAEQAVATVIVSLPGGKAKGRVTNKAGDPAKADVVIFRNSNIIGDGATLPDGSFDVEGLEPGPVTLLAITRGAESDFVSYLVAEDDPAIVQILLEELTEVKGQLLAQDGAPVAGAVVRYSAAGMTRRREAVSDPNGEFAMRIPKDAQSLLAAIVVDGFPVTLQQFSSESTGTQRIILSTASASLHIVKRPGPDWPMVTLDGRAFLSVTSLLGLPMPDGRRGLVDDGIQVPIAPGVYAICSARGQSTCQVARVASGHDQTITMDSTKSK